jgi:hypothetical protein
MYCVIMKKTPNTGGVKRDLRLVVIWKAQSVKIRIAQLLAAKTLSLKDGVVIAISVQSSTSIIAEGKEVLAYPNPVRDHVIFIFDQDNIERIDISSYNYSRERIAELCSAAPERSIGWDTIDIAPGVYLVKAVLTVNGESTVLLFKKVAIVK